MNAKCDRGMCFSEPLVLESNGRDQLDEVRLAVHLVQALVHQRGESPRGAAEVEGHSDAAGPRIPEGAEDAGMEREADIDRPTLSRIERRDKLEVERVAV